MCNSKTRGSASALKRTVNLGKTTGGLAKKFIPLSKPKLPRLSKRELVKDSESA